MRRASTEIGLWSPPGKICVKNGINESNDEAEKTTSRKTCKPAERVSVLIMQGTKDPLIPYQGGVLRRNGERGQILPHHEAVTAGSLRPRMALLKMLLVFGIIGLIFRTVLLGV
jgi:hypothetical protein